MSDQTTTTSLSPIKDYNTLELTAARDLIPLKGKVYDLTTEDGMAEAKGDLKAVTSFLTRFETIRKAVKDEPYQLCLKIDSEAKRITKPIEDEIKTPLKAKIAAEENRLADIDARRVKAIRDKIAQLTRRPAWGATAGQIEGMLEDAQDMQVDATFAEFEDEAAVAKAEALRDLRQMLETARQVEAQQAAAREAEAAAKAAADLAGPPDIPAGHARLANPQAAPVMVPGGASEPGPALRPPRLPADIIADLRALLDSLAFGAVGEDRERVLEARALVDELALWPGNACLQ